MLGSPDGKPGVEQPGPNPGRPVGGPCPVHISWPYCRNGHTVAGLYYYYFVLGGSRALKQSPYTRAAVGGVSLLSNRLG